MVLNKRIAYILGTYPLPTTTFIDREIIQTIRNGVDLELVAVRKHPAFEKRPELEQVASRIHYILPVPWLKFLFCNLLLLATHFRTYMGTLFYFIRHKDPNLTRLKALLHFWEGVRTVHILRDKYIDHLHAHFADRASTLAMVASAFLKIPYSLTAHAADIYVSPVMLKEKIDRAKFVATCTGYNKKHLEAISGKPVELVYHGIDFDQILPSRITSRKNVKQVVLSIGQLKKKKGFEHLIRACSLIRTKRDDFVCEIIGEGPEREHLEQLIRRLQLENFVRLLGYLPNEKVMRKYVSASLFVLACVVDSTGDRDGIPNVLLEAMAHRVPVISTKLSGIPEVVHGGVNGLLVDAGDEIGLSNAIERLLNDASLQDRYGAEGYRLVREQFDIRRNIDRLIQLFRT
jgi:glycosyltransferase involved in cell wall biosynthesis